MTPPYSLFCNSWLRPSVFSPLLITYEILQAQRGLNDLMTAMQVLNIAPQHLCANQRIQLWINPSYQDCTVKTSNSVAASTIYLFDQCWLCTLLQDKKGNQSKLYLCSLAHTSITSSLSRSAFMTLITIPCEHLIIFNVHVLQQSSEVWQYYYSH